jgi:uncharacterized protein (TIGR02118 family)
MFKIVGFARFRPDLSNAQARRYWAEVHGPLVLPTATKRYAQNHVIGSVPTVSGVAEEATHFDGFACAWWNDRADYDATMASPEWQAVWADGSNVFDMNWLTGMSAQVREHTVIDGPAGPFKVVWVCRFKAGIDPAEAHRHWEEVHGPIFISLDIDRYVQNHVVAALPDGDSPGFDGFSECWFRDEGQFRAAVESDAWAEAVVDGENFLDFSQLWGAVLEERVVKGG